jgi:hypothetical protein
MTNLSYTGEVASTLRRPRSSCTVTTTAITLPHRVASACIARRFTCIGHHRTVAIITTTRGTTVTTTIGGITDERLILGLF